MPPCRSVYIIACVVLVGTIVSFSFTDARPLRASSSQTKEREQRRRSTESELQARDDSDDSNNDGSYGEYNSDDTPDVEAVPKKSASILDRRSEESQYEPSSTNESSDEAGVRGAGIHDNRNNDDEFNGEPEFDNDSSELSTDQVSIDEEPDGPSSNESPSGDEENLTGNNKKRYLSLANIVDQGSENHIQALQPKRQFSYSKPQQEVDDLSAAASHGHHHGHHGSGGMLIMGAHTGKKGSFGWHGKFPVGKGK